MPTLSVRDQPLPYIAKLEPRALSDINLVVIHCTELPDLAMAREYGERSVHPNGSGNSGHYYIDRDGSSARYVPDDRIAHHVRGHNEHSIGIELVNTGRYPDWFDSRRQIMREAYPDAQIAALLTLLADLQQRLPHLRHIAGHEELDTGSVTASDDPALTVRRKLDPGIQFPWPRVMTACGLERLPLTPQPV